MPMTMRSPYCRRVLSWSFRALRNVAFVDARSSSQKSPCSSTLTLAVVTAEQRVVDDAVAVFLAPQHEGAPVEDERGSETGRGEDHQQRPLAQGGGVLEPRRFPAGPRLIVVHFPRLLSHSSSFSVGHVLMTSAGREPRAAGNGHAERQHVQVRLRVRVGVDAEEDAHVLAPAGRRYPPGPGGRGWR